jgi:hypothetical protein
MTRLEHGGVPNALQPMHALLHACVDRDCGKRVRKGLRPQKKHFAPIPKLHAHDPNLKSHGSMLAKGRTGEAETHAPIKTRRRTHKRKRQLRRPPGAPGGYQSLEACQAPIAPQRQCPPPRHTTTNQRSCRPTTNPGRQRLRSAPWEVVSVRVVLPPPTTENEHRCARATDHNNKRVAPSPQPKTSTSVSHAMALGPNIPTKRFICEVSARTACEINSTACIIETRVTKI